MHNIYINAPAKCYTKEFNITDLFINSYDPNLGMEFFIGGAGRAYENLQTGENYYICSSEEKAGLSFIAPVLGFVGQKVNVTFYRKYITKTGEERLYNIRYENMYIQEANDNIIYLAFEQPGILGTY